jgi:hypothetical protein
MEETMPLEPDSTFDAGNAIAILEEEVGRMFGPAGKFIVNKQIELYKGRERLTEEDIPVVIEKIADVLASLIGAKLARDFKIKVKRRCGLPI